MKFIKQSPLLALLVVSGLVLTLIGLLGKRTIYRDEAYDPWKTPLLSLVFTGANDEVYPWDFRKRYTGNSVKEGEEDESASASENIEESLEAGAGALAENVSGESVVDAQEGEETETSTSENMSIDTQQETAEIPVVEEKTPEPVIFGEGRPLPLRESTKEEYLNHVSADIYGDVGILKAAEYEFVPVEESYFDDALFIGDSRIVGLMDYSGLAEHADFLCKTSLTVYKVLDENFKGQGTVAQTLAANDYGKIYIMLGINELGRGTTEDFMKQYTTVVDTIHKLEPDAKIIIQAILKVAGKKDSTDKIFNNTNITARNHAIATLADNQTCFYIDVNEVTSDENGNLNAEYTFDQIHLLGAKYEIWKEFLMQHGVQ